MKSSSFSIAQDGSTSIRSLNAGFNFVKDEISEKINNYGEHLKHYKESAKVYHKSLEILCGNIGSINRVNQSVTEIIQWNRPTTYKSQKICFPMKLIWQAELYRYDLLTDIINKDIPESEELFEKKFRTIKNYTKAFEDEEKDRLDGIKRTEHKIKKLKHKSKSDDNSMNSETIKEYNDKCYDLTQLRKEFLSKLMTDENMLYMDFLNLNLKMLKCELVSKEQIDLYSLREELIPIQNLVENDKGVPIESEVVLKNLEDFVGENLRNQSFFSTFKINQKSLDLNMNSDDNLSEFESNLMPHPREVIFQYIGASNIELDLVRGDLIVCVSNEYDGWQYGVNMKTNKKGWFPVSFTQISTDKMHTKKMSDYIKSKVPTLNT